MNKKFKIFLILIFLLVAGFFSARYYAYHAGKRDIQSEVTAFTLKTKDIVSEFTTNETAANKKYLEKPIEISGTVTSVNEKEVVVDKIVVCNFLIADNTIKVGQAINIKGRVVGYDDLLGGLNLDQCSVNK